MTDNWWEEGAPCQGDWPDFDHAVGVATYWKRKAMGEYVSYEDCLEYLSNLHTVLWGEAFDLHDDEGKAKAAAWLYQTFDEIREMKSQGGM